MLLTPPTKEGTLGEDDRRTAESGGKTCRVLPRRRIQNEKESFCSGAELLYAADGVQRLRKKTIRRNEGTLDESVTSMLDKAAENTVSSPAAETVDRTAEFQAVMDAVSVDSRYASCKRYVMVNDYDGDGKQEAFGILAGDQTDWGFSDWARIYYISSDGFIFCAQSSRADGTQLYGYLPGSDGYAADPQSCLLTAGNQKFLRWELSAGGSGSVTSILGVKDGVPYHPQISEMYQDVRQQGGKYYGTTSDFSRDFHDYIDHELVFDPAQGEFSEK